MDDCVFKVVLGLVCLVRIGPYPIACAVCSVTAEVLRAGVDDAVSLAGSGLQLWRKNHISIRTGVRRRGIFQIKYECLYLD